MRSFAARLSLALSVLLLSACALPERAQAPLRYDFGPAAGPLPDALAARPVLALRVQASTALESTAMLYRLAYADAQQLRAYAQSRWAMPPAELLLQRLREGLAPYYTLSLPGEGGAARLLAIEVEEFSQQFSAPTESHGLLRLRASVLQRTATGEQLLAQRVLHLQQPAPSPDAAGGVRALAAASDAAVAALLPWLAALR